jgi:hypothetical protein
MKNTQKEWHPATKPLEFAPDPMIRYRMASFRRSPRPPPSNLASDFDE